MIFAYWSIVILGAPRFVASIPRLVVSAARLLASAPRCSQVHPKFSPAHRGVPGPIIITSVVLFYQSSEVSVTQKVGRSNLLWSDSLLKLMHLSLHSTSSQTLLESSSEYNTCCWCWTTLGYSTDNSDILRATTRDEQSFSRCVIRSMSMHWIHQENSPYMMCNAYRQCSLASYPYQMSPVACEVLWTSVWTRTADHKCIWILRKWAWLHETWDS